MEIREEGSKAEDSVSVLSGSWDSDDSDSMSLESVGSDEDSAMESAMTKTMVERNMRNRLETVDKQHQVEKVQAEDEEKNHVLKFLLTSNPVAFDCIGALLHQNLWWWGMGSELMHKMEVTMRTLHMNIVDNWESESELIEDVEWLVA